MRIQNILLDLKETLMSEQFLAYWFDMVLSDNMYFIILHSIANKNI